MTAPIQAQPETRHKHPYALRGLRDEVRRKLLREAEERYKHELMGGEERQVLRDRILKLRRDLDDQEEQK